MNWERNNLGVTANNGENNTSDIGWLRNARLIIVFNHSKSQLYLESNPYDNKNERPKK